MTAEKPQPLSDINALASEVMDLWQEHLSLYATDPTAKAELARLLEPQRQLFADWAAMMQTGAHGPSTPYSATTAGTGHVPSAAAAATQSAPAAAASDDSALRVAQLACRLAELEKRVSRLEAEQSDARKTRQRRKAD